MDGRLKIRGRPARLDRWFTKRRRSFLRRRGFLQPPLPHRQTLEQDESLAIKHLPPNCAEERLERRQREEFLMSQEISRSALGQFQAQKKKKKQIIRSRKNKLTFAIPVNGLPLAINSSAALPSSSTSLALKTCVHRSGLSR